MRKRRSFPVWALVPAIAVGASAAMIWAFFHHPQRDPHADFPDVPALAAELKAKGVVLAFSQDHELAPDGYSAGRPLCGGGFLGGGDAASSATEDVLRVEQQGGEYNRPDVSRDWPLVLEAGRFRFYGDARLASRVREALSGR